MFGRLYLIISSEEEKDFQMIKASLLEMNPNFSISPSRPCPTQKDSSEFFITFDTTKEDAKELLDKLNNDWTGEEDDCESYGFNTKMFHELVYYIQFTLFD